MSFTRFGNSLSQFHSLSKRDCSFPELIGLEWGARGGKGVPQFDGGRLWCDTGHKGSPIRRFIKQVVPFMLTPDSRRRGDGIMMRPAQTLYLAKPNIIGRNNGKSNYFLLLAWLHSRASPRWKRLRCIFSGTYPPSQNGKRHRYCQPGDRRFISQPVPNSLIKYPSFVCT
ncbi:hypothetical protein KQX54_020634 [Cotesia glomerata]|uniref:Uncharacterized protein n=1 Tax=Cotesia glomerata TaxID=32391 RepID=A0AAV7I0A1_COTGL|nr:hypothetical protein KQX54_020634 [Cotesia glomerata]